MGVRRLDYVADGILLHGLLAEPAGQSGGAGVLVAHEAPGLNDHVVSRAEALAQRGYVALALDLHGETFPLEETLERHNALMSTPGLIFRRAAAGLNALRSHPAVDPRRIGAIGFCQGGVTIMELARGADIRCAIGLHPALSRPAGSPEGPIRASVLMIVGDLDPLVSWADRQAFGEDLTVRGVDWQLQVLGGVGHSFTNPDVDALQQPGFAYDDRAAARAWAMTIAHLDDAIA